MQFIYCLILLLSPFMILKQPICVQQNKLESPSHPLFQQATKPTNCSSTKLFITISTQSQIPHSLYNYSIPPTNTKSKLLTTKQYSLSLKTKLLFILRNQKLNQSIIELRQKQVLANSGQLQNYHVITKISIKPNLQSKKIQLTFQSIEKYIRELQNTNYKYNSNKHSKQKYKQHQTNQHYSTFENCPKIVVNKEIDKQGKCKGYNLKVGQIICFGKIKYLVRQIKINNQLQILSSTYDKIPNYIADFVEQEGKQQGIEQVEKMQEEHKQDNQGLQNDKSNQQQQKSQGQNFQYQQQQQQQKCIANQQKQQYRLKSQDQQEQQLKNLQQKQADTPQCRICFDTLSTPYNKLINICKCTGSCKFTHLNCLRQWIETKAKIQNRQYCITIERINCQLCKSEIPMSLNLNSNSNTNRDTNTNYSNNAKTYNEEIVLIQRPKNTNYVILQRIQGQKNILIIKNPPYEGISIGRDNSCYIKLNDISVSRVHAFIAYNAGHFCVFDKNSKFGTLIVEEPPLCIDIGMISRGVQIGRTLLSMVVKKEKKSLLTDLQF